MSMSTESTPPHEEAYMHVRLKVYLDELAQQEQRKPKDHRREIPSMTELAEFAGIHKGTLSRWVTGEIRSINLDVMQKIATALYRRGFRPDISDLVGLEPPEESAE